jgi:hypothetical protein
MNKNNCYTNNNKYMNYIDYLNYKNKINLSKFIVENKEQLSNTEIIKKIKNIYKDELSNYKYIEPSNYNNIITGTYICYVKNNLEKKHGFLKSIKNADSIDNVIFELINNRKNRTWYIYTKDVYVFIKEKNKDKFRDLLQSFLDSDFSDLTLMTSKKTIL